MIIEDAGLILALIVVTIVGAGIIQVLTEDKE